MKRVCLLALLAAASCSGADRGDGPRAPRAAEPRAAEPRAGARDAPLTGEECEQFFDHVIDIEVERWQKEKSAEEMPSPEQIREIRQRFKEKEMERCLAQRRADWRCAVAAETRDEVEACASRSER